MTQSFQDYLKNCAWMGGEFGYPTADEVVSLLQAYQVGNAGVAQAVARFKAKRERRAGDGIDFDNYDSDDTYPDLPEEEDWYPLDRAAKKVTSKATPHLGVWWLYADHANTMHIDVHCIHWKHHRHACDPQQLSHDAYVA